MKLIEVLIEHGVSALNHPFTYLYFKNKDIRKGYRVLLNFNNQELIGYVLSVSETSKTKEELKEETGFEYQEILDVIDTQPILNDDLFNLANEISDYYVAPFISVLQSMLPKSLSPRKSSLKGPKIAYDQFVIIKDTDETNLTHKQIELLRLITKLNSVNKREISQKAVLEKLLELGKVEIIKKEKRRFAIPDYKYEEPPALTLDQQRVIDEINNSNDNVYLLQGVTGSGKTEIYLKLSEQILEKGKSVLMLVPEISLTPMMMEYFIRRFKNNVAILHSELTPAEKYDEYRKIAKGECKIVIGARSAIFAPLSNIGLIILDEEHVESYKQDKQPYYHAREVAIMRSKTHNAKVILGSATPSIESRAKAQNGLYHLLKLDKRINNQPLPNPEIIDMLNFHNIDRESYLFSFQLRRAIQEVLDKHEQAILLINRRGHSTTVSCRKCGHVFKCPNCGIPLTYHKEDNMLKCHHCEHVELLPETCPECGSNKFIKTGFGTERIEEEVHRLFPSAKTLRLDSDSGKVRTRIPQIVEEFRERKADILIGTQMIAKGHDFPNVTLVGIVLADLGLTMPSYRSSERTFQLITQAIGRSGRKDKKGIAIIQTYMPKHYAIQIAARQDFELFYEVEKKERKLLKFPPYTYLASVEITSKSEKVSIEGAEFVIDVLKSSLGNQALVLGPVIPFVPYQNDSYSRQVLIKYRDLDLIKNELHKLSTSFINKSRFNIKINIDPYDF